jgi:opacity protein-like surface antigen
MRRLSIVLTVVGIGITASARAQGTAASSASHTYAEFVVGPTFGHNTDVSFGGEVGFPYKRFHVFVEGGTMRNVTTADMEAAAIKLTTPPSPLAAAGTATYTLKQTVGYFAGGLRFNLREHGKLAPYISAAIGGAKVTKNNRFFVNGSDVTDQLLDLYGVQLGSDLAGTETRTYLEFGVGTHINITDRMLGDVSYRYGRVFLDEPGMNTNRLQFGIGFAF